MSSATGCRTVAFALCATGWHTTRLGGVLVSDGRADHYVLDRIFGPVVLARVQVDADHRVRPNVLRLLGETPKRKFAHLVPSLRERFHLEHEAAARRRRPGRRLIPTW